MSEERDAQLRALEQRLGHCFRDRALLARSLTHSSHAHESLGGDAGHNEPLEFLGDAVLGFLVADVLHRRDPEGSEGGKSKARAAMVSAVSLARHAQALMLPDLIRLGRGEEKTGGRAKTALWADAYEALVAALYLDGGIDAARAFVERDFAADLERGAALTASDAKSALQELLHRLGQPPPAYRVLQETGPPHRKLYHVECRLPDGTIAHGQGHSKKAAEQKAAALGLFRLQA